MISRLLKVIGLICKRAQYKRLYSAKETYNFREPGNRSHPIFKKAISKAAARAHTHTSHTRCPRIQHTLVYTKQHNTTHSILPSPPHSCAYSGLLSTFAAMPPRAYRTLMCSTYYNRILSSHSKFLHMCAFAAKTAACTSQCVVNNTTQYIFHAQNSCTC